MQLTSFMGFAIGKNVTVAYVRLQPSKKELDPPRRKVLLEWILISFQEVLHKSPREELKTYLKSFDQATEK